MKRLICALVLISIVAALAAGQRAWAGGPWLSYMNLIRASADLPDVTENTAWSYGGWLHSRYCVKNNFIGHTEDPANTWYTTQGESAAESSNVMASSSVSSTDQYAIDLWMQGPFHAVGIIDPALAVAGYGSYREADGGYQMAASLNVLDGLGTVPPWATFPVTWPSDGKTIHLTSYGGSEFPSPLTSCPGYTSPTGLPVILQIGSGGVTPSVTASSFTRGSTSLDHCIFHEGTYTNTDASQQSLGRAVLNMRDAIILIPKSPLTNGGTYTVSVTANGQTHTWSFSVGPVAAAGVWNSLPGLSPSSPALAWHDTAKALRMVVRAANGSLWASSFSATGWFNNDWRSIPGSSGATPGLAWNPFLGIIQMVVRAPDDTLWGSSFGQDGTTLAPWTPLSGKAASAPALAWHEGTQEMVLLVRAHDNSLWKSTFDRNGAFKNNWQRIIGSTDASPALAWNQRASRLQVVIKASDGSLWASTFGPDGAFAGTWQSLPGRAASSPALVWHPRNNAVQLMVRGGDDTIWSSSFDGSGVFRNNWTMLSGSTPTSPGLALNHGLSMMQSVVRGGDGSLWHMIH